MQLSRIAALIGRSARIHRIILPGVVAVSLFSFSALLALGAGSSAAFAATVVPNSNVEFSTGGDQADYVLTVFQDAEATDFTSVFLDFDGEMFTGFGTNIDEGSDWYRVQQGDIFAGSEM